MLMVFVISTMVAQDTISAYVIDEGKQMTNIRNSPQGAVVMKLRPTPSYVFLLTTPDANGWWRAVDIYNAEGDEEITLTGSATDSYWIHYSVIGLGTRNYGGQTLVLRSEPTVNAPVVFSFADERILRPVDVCGEWMKVKTVDGKHVGWIEMEWLCSNPLTNCC